MGQVQRKKRIAKEVLGRARPKVIQTAWRRLDSSIRAIGEALKQPGMIARLQAETQTRFPRVDISRRI